MSTTPSPVGGERAACVSQATMEIIQSPLWWGRKGAIGPIWVKPAELALLIEAALQHEREACARIAQQIDPAHGGKDWRLTDHGITKSETAQAIAEAIRSRGKP